MKINSFRYSYSCEIKWAFSVIISNQLLINWCPPLANTFLWKLITVEWYFQTWYISWFEKKLCFYFIPFPYIICFSILPCQWIHALKDYNCEFFQFFKTKSFKLFTWCFSHCKFSIIITYVRHKIKALSVEY